MGGLDLDTRTGLPDALRVLLAEFPRDEWQQHSNFGELVQFWMQRHLMFREVLGRLQTDTRTYLDKASDTEHFRSRLSRLGGFFLNELHAHHRVEDVHYFPRLQRLDTRIAHGFDLLDADHGKLESMLEDFAATANKAVNAQTQTGGHDAAGDLAELLSRFDGFLDRHLSDEEDLIVPVILKNGFRG